MATVTIHTADAAWLRQAEASDLGDGRASVPGCEIVNRYTFCGREWVNYILPAHAGIPTDWNIGVKAARNGVLAAPAVDVED